MLPKQRESSFGFWSLFQLNYFAMNGHASKQWHTIHNISIPMFITFSANLKMFVNYSRCWWTDELIFRWIYFRFNKVLIYLWIEMNSYGVKRKTSPKVHFIVLTLEYSCFESADWNITILIMKIGQQFIFLLRFVHLPKPFSKQIAIAG